MRAGLALCAIALSLSACAPPHGAGGGQGSRLDNQIAQAIGDPTTCLLLADRATGKVTYQYGESANCSRALPACDAPGTLTAQAALRFAAQGRLASCASNADGSRHVGWAEGRVQSTKSDLIYSAVMEGERALPGHEMNARLYDAFAAAGL